MNFITYFYLAFALYVLVVGFISHPIIGSIIALIEFAIFKPIYDKS